MKAVIDIAYGVARSEKITNWNVMFSREIEALLKKNLPDMPRIVAEHSLARDIDELVCETLPVSRIAIVDDTRTAQVYGDQVVRALQGKYSCVRITLEGFPTADQPTAQHIRREATTCDALLAVGGGTINDLCKLASFLDKKSYAVIPTAASMNGYVSANASVTVDGYKQTLPAHLPKAVLCDLSMIAQAPARLNKSGLGDSLARSTAQSDWLLSHLLLGTPYDDTPFQLLQSLEPQLLEQARGISKGDTESVALLLQVLLLSGYGMTIAGGSYPASQAEHMMAHAYHMLAEARGENISTLHGEEIGVTALAMAQRQEIVLRSLPSLASLRFPDAAMVPWFGESNVAQAHKTYQRKLDTMEQADLSSSTFKQRWENVQERISQIHLPAAKIRAVLEAADAPQAPQALGWDEEAYNAACNYARFLRERFTFLDVQFIT